ncbi:sigma-70 factor, region 1.2 family protein [Mycobacterium xenopi 3993]|nr:sigma-70 factor, region 1.2 family protein [Mycobacterium xenopi 3993]
MANATTGRVDSDLDAQSPAADLVRVYLNGIGKTALLNAADEVELAKRIEAGLYAQYLLETRKRLGRTASGNWRWWSATVRRRAGICWKPTCGWWCRWPSATPAAACRCWTSSRKAISA